MRWSVDQDGTWISLLVADGQMARAYAEANRDKPQRVTLKQWREKRSLSANAYAWVLLGKLSEKLHIPPVEIYRELIPDVGDNAQPITIKAEAVDAFREYWESIGLGSIVEVVGAGAEPETVDLMAYYGSSTYDRAQMARLIDLIIQECRENDVEYLPPDKLAAMLEEWR